MEPILSFGTRGSPLALAQSRMVASSLEVAHHWIDGRVAIVPITTSGDRIADRPLAEVGGKALWTKELDEALLGGRTDGSVHSLKDVESERPEALTIAAVLARGDPRDRLIGAGSIDDLPKGARVGTSSPRRAAQLLKLRPDLAIGPIRGNVDTRLAKVESGEFDATLLAAAGLDRLGRHRLGAPLPIELMLPAPGQGAIGIECRADDDHACSMVQRIDDKLTNIAVRAERAFARALGGSCHSPVGALAEVHGGKVRLRVELLSEDGREHLAEDVRFACGDDEAPAELARALLAKAPESIRRLFAPA